MGFYSGNLLFLSMALTEFLTWTGWMHAGTRVNNCSSGVMERMERDEACRVSESHSATVKIVKGQGPKKPFFEQRTWAFEFRQICHKLFVLSCSWQTSCAFTKRRSKLEHAVHHCDS